MDSAHVFQERNFLLIFHQKKKITMIFRLNQTVN